MNALNANNSNSAINTLNKNKMNKILNLEGNKKIVMSPLKKVKKNEVGISNLNSHGKYYINNYIESNDFKLEHIKDKLHIQPTKFKNISIKLSDSKNFLKKI